MRNSSNNDSNMDNLSDGDDLIDAFFDKLEKEVSSIELEEILKGVTTAELEEKGFIGDKEIDIKSKTNNNTGKENGIEIESSIKYYEKRGKDITEISLDSILFLPDVPTGTVIAQWTIPKVKNNERAHLLSSICNSKYLDMANIVVKATEEKVVFISRIKGKVILFNYLPYIYPCDIDGCCCVKVKQDRMQAVIDMVPARGDGVRLNIDMVKNELSEKSVFAGINENVINKCLEQINSTGVELDNIVIAEGLLPVDGKDAQIEFKYQKESKTDEFHIMPDGRIDYHKKVNIPVVHSGDVLALIGVPTMGQDGFDVMGGILKAKEGKLPELVAGENISVSKDGKQFVAECDGQVALNGKIINVFQHFLVDGDVDYRSGNIDFNGNVTINGMVLEGFQVKATGDITVMKDIESASVLAGRDLKVVGGIICRSSNVKITCGRDLYANHLQNAVIEVQRDVHIGNSCVQSTVYCNGKMCLQSQKGAVIGGVINAMEGVDSRNIGTEMGTKTEVVAGNDYLAQKTAMEFRKILKIYMDNQQKIDSLLLPFISQIKNKIAIGLEKKNRLAIVLEKRKRIKKNIEMLEWKLKDVESRIPTDVTAIIKVNDTIWADVNVKIKDCTKKISSPLHHVTIYYDKKNQQLNTGPY